MADASVHFLAVDLGASSGRVIHGQFDGRKLVHNEIHRFANVPVHVPSVKLDTPASQHWDVLRLWHDIQQGISRYDAAAPLTSLSVDTWGVDFALLDARQRLLTNPYHYRDSRNDGLVDEVLEQLAKKAIYEHTGVQFMQINTLYQLYGMVMRQDPLLEVAKTLMMMPDLFHFWLSGEMTLEVTDASTTQMLDARARTWATPVLDALKLPSYLLPEVTPDTSVVGRLRPDIASQINLARCAVIASAGHDTAAAVAAVPNLDEHSVYISSGTWSLMGIESPEPIISEVGLSMNVTNEAGVFGTVRVLKNLAGLWVLQACLKHWQNQGEDYSWEALLKLASNTPAFGPLIRLGAETFLNPPDMPAAIDAACQASGQTPPDSVGAIVRCCLESLALEYKLVLDELSTVSARHFNAIRIVGGGAQNTLLCQLTADACQLPVVAGPVEATALGNLMLQAIATGHIGSLAEGRQVIAASVSPITYESQPNTDGWQDAYARFRRLPL
ncbi:MAG: rhamnulokinase family protein [Deinococcota bacterium]